MPNVIRVKIRLPSTTYLTLLPLSITSPPWHESVLLLIQVLKFCIQLTSAFSTWNGLTPHRMTLIIIMASFFFFFKWSGLPSSKILLIYSA